MLKIIFKNTTQRKEMEKKGKIPDLKIMDEERKIRILV